MSDFGRYNPLMDANERAIKILDELARAPREVGPVKLTQEYLKAIEYIESLPQNQSGADKSWVPRLLNESRSFYARAKLKR